MDPVNLEFCWLLEARYTGHFLRLFRETDKPDPQK